MRGKLAVPDYEEAKAAEERMRAEQEARRAEAAQRQQMQARQQQHFANNVSTTWSNNYASYSATTDTYPGESAQRQAAMNTNRGETKQRQPVKNTSPKVGRNDPCPCGSGKKYKNCHGRNA